MRAQDGRWEVHREQGAVRVPPGIVALIDARLDRLSGEDRSVLQAGSVIGPGPSLAMMKARSPRRICSQPWIRRFERLMQRQFVRSDRRPSWTTMPSGSTTRSFTTARIARSSNASVPTFTNSLGAGSRRWRRGV